MTFFYFHTLYIYTVGLEKYFNKCKKFFLKKPVYIRFNYFFNVYYKCRIE